MQELVYQNHLVCIRILSWYLNSYATERISEQIKYLFQLYATLHTLDTFLFDARSH